MIEIANKKYKVSGVAEWYILEKQIRFIDRCGSEMIRVMFVRDSFINLSNPIFYIDITRDYYDLQYNTSVAILLRDMSNYYKINIVLEEIDE